ncbi:MAG: exodeoxyribonuclease III [Endozoicomonas sp. (ex Botrylloides leachii)]|nr:exodeoxyribonuclease III [Endozoicomonas sp. (ex Botrylloides leachii)]
MRVISFNCEGISCAKEKGLFKWIMQQDPDIVCLQDIQEDDEIMSSDTYQIEGYLCYSFSGYNRPLSGGVCIYTRQPPKAIITGLGYPESDDTGRYIQADFDKISISNIYIPEGKDDDSQHFKYKFLDGYSQNLSRQRRKRREFIMTGTWNIAHRKIDVFNWRESEKKSGFKEAERNWMEGLLNDMNFFDAYREVDQEPNQFTWWQDEYMRQNNIGMRLDYHIITAGMRQRVLNGGIYKGQMFSSHAPVIIDYDWELNI